MLQGVSEEDEGDKERVALESIDPVKHQWQVGHSPRTDA
jgi:hypothetical protein